jgi:hypothetical protein
MQDACRVVNSCGFSGTAAVTARIRVRAPNGIAQIRMAELRSALMLAATELHGIRNDS